ncbi:glycosyltransferase family 2 protein [Companilactobacillus kedongensis]|uniref:glycosyltransferase family 2 protein n=1 Tax=Companilactobacillus kedongensis TaxID=2486004 RepID=UPI000F78D65D|nr:glycosyltransferase [Companilactobacillus kedongensis]
MTENKLSIIVSAYNVAGYINKTIESLIAQTNKNFEVIIVDDCSTDNTLDVIRKYEEEYNWIRVVCHAQNAGVSAARNSGLQVVKTDLVTFVDGDDFVEPEYVDFFLSLFKEYDLDMATCGFFNDNGKKNKRIDRQNSFVDRDEAIKQIIKINGTVMGYTWNKVYRTSIIKKNNLSFQTDLDLMEDEVFNVEYATLAQKFYLDNKPLYHYVSRKDSASRKVTIENVRDVGLANLRVYRTIHGFNDREEME